MPILINPSDLSAKIANNTATFIEKLSEETRGFACSLWRNYPDFLTKNNALARSFVRGYMNNLCQDKLLPINPGIPWTGGQCPNLYKVTWQSGYNVSPGVYNWTQVAESQLGIGPYQRLVFRNSNTGAEFINVTPDNPRFAEFPWRLRAYRADGTFDERAFPFGDKEMLRLIPWSVVDSGISLGGNSTISGNDYFRRVDNLPDDCGDPPSEYPPTNPQPSDFTTVINLLSEDGDTLTYNLEYIPTNNLSFPINFNLGGIEVVFDLGGINFNFSLLSIDGIPLPLPDGQDPPLPAPSDDVNRIIRCQRRYVPNANNYNESERSLDDPKTELVGNKIEFVKVTLNNMPKNVKQQFGVDGPNVIYAGWFEFQAESYNFVRQPIHFINSLFVAPEGATGYAYTLYEGITGSATIYTFKEEV